MRPMERELDLVLFGATGYTGKLIADYLAAAAEPPRWGIAGRSAAKLAALQGALAAAHPSACELPQIVADLDDPRSLEAMARRSRAVITTAGPYGKRGASLVEACLAAGTHYADLTGEIGWVRRMIDAHHEEARQTGARIVHACGFDSIPSDLGVLMLQEYLREHHGGHCDRVRYYLTRLRGRASGGTVATMLQTVDETAADRSVLRILGNPHALEPEPRRGTPEERDQVGVRYSEELGRWTGPFVMASVNTRVVRRSNALLGHPWGKDFLYSEVSAFAPGVKGMLSAAGVSAGLGAFLVATRVPPLRRLLEKRVLPAPGEGPSAEERERGLFEVRLIGEGRSPRTGGTVRLEGTVAAQGDPGYAATSRMLAESALCLAFDELPAEGGILTPASSMGARLIERLRRAGMTFEVREARA
jgi:short subunit dehydrogenase-like uncharacterized protein